MPIHFVQRLLRIFYTNLEPQAYACGPLVASGCHRCRGGPRSFRGRSTCQQSPAEAPAMRRDYQLNFDDFDPPICSTCESRQWPVVRNVKGKYHCAHQDCRSGKPGDWYPQYASCGPHTWNGLWRGKAMCKNKCGFMYSRCWVSASAPSEHDK